MGSRGQETTIPDTVLAGPSGAGSTLAIRWVFPSDDGLLTRLEPGTTTLGRDPACTGALPSASVSRRHAEIRWAAGGTPLLLDLNSTNGVFVNGQRGQERQPRRARCGPPRRLGGDRRLAGGQRLRALELSRADGGVLGRADPAGGAGAGQAGRRLGPADDHRGRDRRRQGGGGPRHPRLERPVGGVRGAQLRRAPRGARRGGAVRLSQGGLHRRRARQPPATCARPRGGRCSSTRSPSCRCRSRPSCCAPSSSASSARSASRRRSPSTCASWPPRRARWGWRSPRNASAAICWRGSAA